MPVLKDAFCSDCGREQEVYMDAYETETEEFCKLCDDIRIFYSKCTGGTKSRWRYIDWDGYNAKGAMANEATSITHNVKQEDGTTAEKPLPHKVYGTVDEYERKKGPERDDRFEFNYKKKRGQTPLIFDTKQKS